MAVNLSPVGGVAGQFFDNNGNPLVGGKLFTYAAGTTTPQVTYTSSSGNTPNSNPIILNGGGRVPSEIWLTDGFAYKFVLYTSTDQLVGSWDNISGINSNFVNFTSQQEIQTATAGQTVFTLTTMQYQPGTNSLTVYVDGVNQYGPGALFAYTETNSTTITFNSGLHVGAEVKFTTVQQATSSAASADQVSYTPAGSGAVVTNVQTKLRETVSVKDFGAVGDGVTDDSAAFIAAREAVLASGLREVYVPAGDYLLTQQNVMGCRDTAAAGVTQGFTWRGAGMRVTNITFNNAIQYMIVNDNDQQFINYIGFSFDGDSVSQTSKFMYVTSASQAQSVRFDDCRWRFWYTIALHEGTANASEMVYNLCKAQTIYGPAFIYDNIQSVNHISIASDWEVMYDDVWWFKRGGHLNVFGGSIIVGGNGSTTGAVLHTDDLSGVGVGFNNWTFNIYGVRTELKDDSKFLNGQSSGVVNLNGCNTEVITGTSGRVIYTLYEGLMVNVNGGHLNGKVYLQATNASAYNLPTRPATFYVSGAFLANGFNWEIQDVTNTGGEGHVIIENCKRQITGGIQEPLDQVVGWQNSMAGLSTKKRVATVHNPIREGGLPVGGQQLTIKLPINAVVTSVRLYHPAQSGPASQTYTLKNLDGTTTLETWTFAIGSTQTTATTLYHVCANDNERTLIFAGDAGNDTASYNGHLEIEYIA